MVVEAEEGPSKILKPRQDYHHLGSSDTKIVPCIPSKEMGGNRKWLRDAI